MADSNFRPFRSRDSLAREDVDPTSDAARDPLAELARIIGQSNRVNQFDRAPRHDVAWRRWTNRCRHRQTAIGRPMTATPSRTRRSNIRINTRKKTTFSRGFPTLIRPIAPVAAMTATMSARRRSPANIPSRPRLTTMPATTSRAYDARYRDEDPPRPAGRQPALAPQSYDDEYEAEDQWDDQADRQSDDAEDYDDEATARPRRSGLVVVLAMLGLVMIGAGGAFAYRAMFGGAILAPSLPPVIKANDAPNKIVPNRSDAQTAASNPAGTATSGAPDKLVSREEQPVAIQPANAPPRVVSTIPVLPAPGAAPAGPPAAVAPAPPAAPALPSAPPKVAAPAQPPAAPLAGSGEPKKIHTVTIRSDQVGNPSAAAPAPAPAAPAPAARPKATEAPARAAAPKAGGNAPLAIVPVAQGAAPAADAAALPRGADRSAQRPSRHAPPRRRRQAAMRSRSPRSAPRPMPRPSSKRSRPNSPASSATGSRSSIAPISATKAPFTAPWSAPSPPRRRPRPCAAI